MSLFAQRPSFNFQKFGSEEGLNNANIFGMAQHSNGLMYFTTQNGIYVYDGYQFKKLPSDSLKSNALQGFAFRNDQELYLSVRDEGLAIYDLRNGNYHLGHHHKLAENNADNFLVDGDYAYMLTSEVKLVTLNLKTGEVIPDALKNPDKPNPAYCIYRTRDGRILVGRGKGVYQMQHGAQQRLPWVNEPVYSLAEDRDGRILAGCVGKILVTKNGVVVKEIVPGFGKTSMFMAGGERPVNRLIADNYGRLWFTAFPEENVYYYDGNASYDVFALLDIPPSLVRCLYRDREQNIWIGTFSDGVYMIQNPYFNTVTFSFNNKILNINQVVMTEGLLIAATSNGLYGMIPGSAQVRTLSSPDELFMEPVSSITEVDGAWYYCKRNQLNMSPSIFMTASRAYRFRPVIARQFCAADKGRSIVADWDANILLCTADGMRTLDTLISFTDYRIAVNGLLLLRDTLYVATSNGLFAYSFHEKKYTLLDRPELNFHINDVALVDGRPFAVHESGITDILARRHIQSAGSLALNGVKRIRQLGEELWIATLDGVLICDRNFAPLRRIDKSEGLLSNSVNDISFDAQHVCIATARGISIASFSDLLRHSSRLNPVTIDALSWNGQDIPVHDGVATLGADQEDVIVHLNSPVFSRPSRQIFRYSIDGGEWIYSGALPQLNLGLRGGTHVLRVSASGDQITWSEPAVLSIAKAEKLSERAYVYWLAVSAALAIVVLVSVLVVRRVKRQARRRLLEEQQVNLLKHQAMNALLSPHFIFNSLTSIQNYINTNNSLKASEYLAKFSRLIRMIIEKAAQGSITLHDELTRLTYYLELEKERFKSKFSYEIVIDPSIDPTKVTIPNMIIQPHVENSILHGILPRHEPGKLTIRFEAPSPGKLRIVVEDDGIGLMKAAEHAKTGHKSLGLATIRDILETNSKLTGKKQEMKMTDKSTIDPSQHGTLITIDLAL